MLTVFAIFAGKVTGLIDSVFVSKSGDQNLTLIENAALDDRWMEFDLLGVNFPRKEINHISIVLDPSYTLSVGKNKGIKAPDGEVFLPQVEVEDIGGKRCVLKFSGGLGEHVVNFSDLTEIRCFSEPGNYKKIICAEPCYIYHKENNVDRF